jgi:S-adenosylmethionine:tRNA ribosyltransferase-isomerase
MKTSEFDFTLPESLIAQYPCEHRGSSRLMTLNRRTGERNSHTCADLPCLLCEPRFLSASGEKPLLVFNDTKVRKARIACFSEKTGGGTEFLLLALMRNKETGKIWKAMAKHTRRKKNGNVFFVYDSSNDTIPGPAGNAITASFKVIGADGEFLILEFDRAIDDKWLDKYGHIPLPPYIKRKDTPRDSQLYQTVYARETGSAAAPTAGLHFTREMLVQLADNGIESAFVTLHVGLGTFLPVRTENIEEHRMHEEQFIITPENAAKIESAYNAGRKIIVVGTTSLRSLESAFSNGKIKHGSMSTSIFIYPGYKFKVVDALFTNFHTPRSTLLMLASAFAGRDFILGAYAEAVRENYRFFSYGDAMLIY